MPQLGPAYLKSCIEDAGHEVSQFDFNIDLYNIVGQDKKRYWCYESEPMWISSNIYSKSEGLKIGNNIPFNDSTINANVNFLSKLCDSIIKEKI